MLSHMVLLHVFLENKQLYRVVLVVMTMGWVVGLTLISKFGHPAANSAKWDMPKQNWMDQNQQMGPGIVRLEENLQQNCDCDGLFLVSARSAN